MERVRTAGSSRVLRHTYWTYGFPLIVQIRHVKRLSRYLLACMKQELKGKKGLYTIPMLSAETWVMGWH